MITVVIPAFNEEKLIANCLSSLAKQTTKKNFEVIVVNNNSTDKTVKIAGEFKKKLNLKIINCKQQGRGAARAKGFNKSSGAVIFSTDADTVVPANWLEKMSNQLTSDYVAITGPNRIADCSILTNFFYNYLQIVFYFFYDLIFNNCTLNGFNFCVNRQAYLKSGGFSKSLNAQEDLDLGFKLIKTGKIKFARRICVKSCGRRYKQGLIKGLMSPLKTFIKYRFKKNNHVSLENIRN